jgi:hypothetical protein
MVNPRSAITRSPGNNLSINPQLSVLNLSDVLPPQAFDTNETRGRSQIIFAEFSLEHLRVLFSFLYQKKHFTLQLWNNKLIYPLLSHSVVVFFCPGVCYLTYERET